MTLAWADERYVRVYTRDTVEWCALRWESRALFVELLRKADRSGIVHVGKPGARGLAGLLRMPPEIVGACLADLIEDGCITDRDGCYVIRNFIEAQESPASDAARKRESRARRRDSALLQPDESRNVTESHDRSRSVTRGHAESLRAVPPVPSRTVPTGEGASAPAPDKPARQPRRVLTAMAPDWMPDAARLALALTLGVDALSETERYRDHWISKGERRADWQAGFANWLRRAREYGGQRSLPNGRPLIVRFGAPPVGQSTIELEVARQQAERKAAEAC